MRARDVVLAAALVLAPVCLSACGGGSGSSSAGTTAAPPAGSISALLNRPGPRVNAIAGSADFAPGPVRLSFLLLDNEGGAVDRPTARVWVARSDDAAPFTKTVATLEPIGVPGSEPATGDVTHIYVSHFRVPKPGIYTVVAEPIGGRQVQGELHIQVRDHPQAPGVGSKAIASKTPTIASSGGKLSELTTRIPPDRTLLRYSVADSLAAHAPFVLVFATPKFCSSRTCGPVVDVVEAVAKTFARTPIRFIHVEIYKDNNPTKGYNRWVTDWHLPSEPWTFLVGRDGRIKARFEGSVSAAELSAAVRRTLL